MSNRNWKDYEYFIYNRFRKLYPDSNIQYDIKKIGVISKIERQIDILISASITGYDINIVVDCKYFNKNVDVTDIDAFAGFLNDVGANKGVIITVQGFSKGAKNRAENDLKDIEIKIVKFDDLEHFQGFGGAMFYNGNCMVTMPCPLGWVIDGRVEPGILCRLYPYGLDFETSIKIMEYIYTYIIPRGNSYSLEEELKVQEEESISTNLYNSEKIKFEYLQGFKNNAEPTAKNILRRVNLPKFNAVEYTSFLEFEKMIFYIVLLTPIAKETRYIRVLELLTKEAIPLGINIIGH